VYFAAINFMNTQSTIICKLRLYLSDIPCPSLQSLHLCNYGELE
jgi:hypothetical protein